MKQTKLALQVTCKDKLHTNFRIWVQNCTITQYLEQVVHCWFQNNLVKVILNIQECLATTCKTILCREPNNLATVSVMNIS